MADGEPFPEALLWGPLQLRTTAKESTGNTEGTEVHRGGRRVGRRLSRGGFVLRWMGLRESIGLRSGFRWVGRSLLGLVVGVCAGQAPIVRVPGGQVPTLKLESRLVTVAVNAVDAHGAPVGGLAQKDFRLLEDGKEQRIAFFDRESTTPLSIVLALDGSESVLRNARIEKQAAEKFVQAVLQTPAKGEDAKGSTAAGMGDELDLVEFSDTVDEMVPFTNDRKRISEGFDRLTRGDATAMYDAIFAASDRLAETNPANGRRRVLVLVTDGGDTVHGVQYPQALEEAQKAGVVVYSLIVVPIYADAGRNTGGEHALIQMAEDTGGKYYYVNDPKDLGPKLQQVSDDLRTQYVLGYYAAPSTVHSRKDGYRALKIDLSDQTAKPGVSLRYRAGYYAKAGN